MSDDITGFRQGRRIVVCTWVDNPAQAGVKHVGDVQETLYKSVNEAKKANRLTRYPIKRGKGE